MPGGGGEENGVGRNLSNEKLCKASSTPFELGSSVLALVARKKGLKRGFFAFEKWGRGQGEWGDTPLFSEILERGSQKEFGLLVSLLWNNYDY